MSALIRHHKVPQQQSRRGRGFVWWLCFLLVVGGLGLSLAQEPPDPNSPAEKHKRWKRVLYWKQRMRLLALQKQESKILTIIESLDRKQVALRDQLRQLRVDAVKVRKEVEKSHKAWKLQQAMSLSLLKSLQPRLRLFYRFTRLGKARLLMGARSLKHLALRWRALELATERDLKLLKTYQDVRLRAKKLSQHWQQKQRKHERLLASMKKKRKQLAKEKRDKALALQSLYREVHLYRRVLQRLRGSGRSLQVMLEKWQQATPVGGLNRLRGQLSWPVLQFSRMCESYTLKGEGSFRSLRCTKKRKTPSPLKGKHQRPGITLHIPEGTPVVSVAAGKVAHRGWIQGYGQVVLLDHGQKFYSLYAHLSYIALQAGQLVREGQAVGLSGDTGILGAPVLYFELRLESRVLPTLKWLKSQP